MIRVVGFVLAAGLTLSGQPKIVSVVDAATFQPGLPFGGGLAAVFVPGAMGR